MPSGEVGDREWMIVDPEGRLVTQREYPRLARIGRASLTARWRCSTEGRAPLAVSSRDRRGPRVSSSSGTAWFPRTTPATTPRAWLSSVLGADVRLVRFDPSHRRLCNPDWAGTSGAHTAFADGYPLLVVTEASLADLNRRLEAKGEQALPMNRFRPNIVLAGMEPYDEDHIDTLAVDGVVIKLVKAVRACQITTTDQDSMQTGAEPLQMLGTYRMDERVGGVTFGLNAIIVEGEGRMLSTGMDVEASFAF